MEELYRLLIGIKGSQPWILWCLFLLIVVGGVIISWWAMRRRRRVKRRLDDLKVTQDSVAARLALKKRRPLTPSSPYDEYVKEPSASYGVLKEKIEKIDMSKRTTKPTAMALSKEREQARKDESIVDASGLLFVEYDLDETVNQEFYPILFAPTNGTVVRSYRHGRTRRRGFKEEAFQQLLEQQLGDDFIVVGDARLYTGEMTRPFEPDIALVEKSGRSNLRIDIEIDEPYAAETREPLHQIGADLHRDRYFVDRGWIVIRFSEYQVHLHEMECVRFVAETIKAAIPGYIIPASLTKVPLLPEEKQWDLVQAQKWEKANYREIYLNHQFQQLKEVNEAIENRTAHAGGSMASGETVFRSSEKAEEEELSLNAQELKEEERVTPTALGVPDRNPAIGCNLVNRHERDQRIVFYPKPHLYTIDKIPVPSVSTIISRNFPVFDSAYWSAVKAQKLGMSPREVLDMWDAKGAEAAQQGTFLHKQIEHYFLGEPYAQPAEFRYFKQFIGDHPHLRPYRSEWRIFDERHHLAGTVDLVAQNSQGFELYDWKRSRKVIDKISGEPISKNVWLSGIGVLCDIDDTGYNRYSLQLSLYRYMLEEYYEMPIVRSCLVVLHPDYDRYYKVEVPYLKKQVVRLLNTL